MSYTNTFLVPDYYPDFSCKCGACRTTCCSGWNITLSMDDYFRVTGTDASPELRRRLDVAFRPAENPAPTPERFAMISYNWQGACPLQRDDGYCALHRECGEGAIPEICRRYPRAPRISPICECCTSNSCERTLELLFENTEPVHFVRKELTFFEDSIEEHPASATDPDTYLQTRTAAFDILSDRTLSLDARLDRLAAMLGTEIPVPTEPIEVCAARFARAGHAMAELMAEFSDDAFPLESVPEMEIYLEKLLVNHLFYKGFPHSFEKSSPRDEMAALAMALALTRYTASHYLAAKGWSMENFIDAVSRLFRMIEHSRFDETAARLAK